MKLWYNIIGTTLRLDRKIALRMANAGAPRQWPSPIFGIVNGKYDCELQNINEGSQSRKHSM